MSHVVEGRKRLLNRVRRLRGQIDAIERALLEEKPCGDLLLTLAASRGAINALMAEILEGHVRSHVLGERRISASQQRAAGELLKVIRSYLR